MMSTLSASNTVRQASLVAITATAAILVASNAGLAEGPDRASQINPYLLLDQSRDELAECYPDLAPRELDLLAFRIADINSLKDPAPAAGPADDRSCTSNAAAVADSADIPAAVSKSSAMAAAEGNISSLLGFTRERIAARYPELTAAELDLVMSRIAAARSMERRPATDH